MKEIELHKAEMLASTQEKGYTSSITRMRVDGGWIYITKIICPSGVGLTQTFVPDSQARVRE